VPVADLIAGRYELERLVGIGGNGRVFAARDRVLDRTVALKLVDAEAVRHRDPAGRERFLAEARTSAGFTHPNAVAVFDAGEADGYLYLVMELVEGPTLADRIESEGPFDPAVAARITADVLAALDAAHRSGIVHRDVKPANVLLAPNGTAKLADFGIAKRLDTVAAGLTSPGQFFGTPKYLAPEQVDGRPVSAATDVYATGVVLFEMLAGRPPFDEGQAMATALAQRDAPVPDLREIRRDVPDTLVAVVERALRKEPDQRFESAEAMRRAVAAPLWPAPPVAARASAEPTTVMRSGAAAPSGAAPTRVLPHGAVPFSQPRRRSGAVRPVAIVLVLVAAVALVLALVLRGGDDEPGEALADTTVAGAETGGTVATGGTSADGPAVAPAPQPDGSPGASAEPVPIPAMPSDIPMLIEFVALDPSAVGARGEALLEGLREVADENGKDQREAADELAARVTEWVDDEELDPGIGSLAQQLLARLAPVDDDTEKDKDKEKDKDD
jgi:serine/threonine-protein kinase